MTNAPAEGHSVLMQVLAQVLASVPDLDIVAYLPLFLSSLMECLTDPLIEVRSKAAKVLQVRHFQFLGDLASTVPRWEAPECPL